MLRDALLLNPSQCATARKLGWPVTATGPDPKAPQARLRRRSAPADPGWNPRSAVASLIGTPAISNQGNSPEIDNLIISNRHKTAIRPSLEDRRKLQSSSGLPAGARPFARMPAEGHISCLNP